MYINSYNQRTEIWWLWVHKVEERPTLTEVTITSVFNQIFFQFCRKVLSSVHNVIKLSVIFCEALKTEASFFYYYINNLSII
jgi:hypothetical protein